MPYLKIQTNCEVTDDQRQDILKKASRSIASGLEKPETSVMVRFDPIQPIMFAGNSNPWAYLEL